MNHNSAEYRSIIITKTYPEKVVHEGEGSYRLTRCLIGCLMEIAGVVLGVQLAGEDRVKGIRKSKIERR